MIFEYQNCLLKPYTFIHGMVESVYIVTLRTTLDNDTWVRHFPPSKHSSEWDYVCKVFMYYGVVIILYLVLNLTIKIECSTLCMIKCNTLSASIWHAKIPKYKNYVTPQPRLKGQLKLRIIFLL